MQVRTTDFTGECMIQHVRLSYQVPGERPKVMYCYNRGHPVTQSRARQPCRSNRTASYRVLRFTSLEAVLLLGVPDTMEVGIREYEKGNTYSVELCIGATASGVFDRYSSGIVSQKEERYHAINAFPLAVEPELALVV